jgi:hypothetical protein
LKTEDCVRVEYPLKSKLSKNSSTGRDAKKESNQSFDFWYMELKIHLKISENTLSLKQETDNIKCLDLELYQINQIHSIKNLFPGRFDGIRVKQEIEKTIEA